MLQTMAQEAPQRYHSIDNLRAGMISVVMFGHALLPYVTVPRRFKDTETHLGFDVAAIFLYGFAMPAFFVTAGFAAALLYQRRGAWGVARSRFRTIFLPLLCAYVLLSPLTRGAYQFAAAVSTSGSIQAGIDVLQLGNWIRWGAAYHLWFLVALLVYTALAMGMGWVVLRILDSQMTRILQTIRRALYSRWRSALMALIAACAMVPAYASAESNAAAVAMQLTGFAYFVFGWQIYRNRDLLPRFQHGAWQQIAIAMAVMPIVVWSTRQRMLSPQDADLVVGAIAGISNCVLASCMTVGLLGVFQGRYDRRPSALGQYVSDASYWIYLIHLPLLIFVAGALSVLPLPALAKYLLTIAIVVPTVFATYHFGVRFTPFGGFLKGRKNESSAQTVA